MKELTIEEKAERYEKALVWMQNLYPTMEGAMKEDAEHYFPELKESEDEKIRNALIRFHKSTIDVDGIKGENIIAWLEKQNKQNPAWSEEDENILRTIISDVIRGAEIDMLQINWLKAIKKRVACEAKCTTKKEWSKEVEIWIDRACMLLDELNHLSTLTLAKIPSNVNDIISHLKSLKDRIGG
jgi:hypothetical protein